MKIKFQDHKILNEEPVVCTALLFIPHIEGSGQIGHCNHSGHDGSVDR